MTSSKERLAAPRGAGARRRASSTPVTASSREVEWALTAARRMGRPASRRPARRSRRGPRRPEVLVVGGAMPDGVPADVRHVRGVCRRLRRRAVPRLMVGLLLGARSAGCGGGDATAPAATWEARRRLLVRGRFSAVAAVVATWRRRLRLRRRRLLAGSAGHSSPAISRTAASIPLIALHRLD